jgi:crotonobetainyl-CoA:carnitine CoA-transferase CaiB-like acyl-CoA transferase
VATTRERGPRPSGGPRALPDYRSIGLPITWSGRRPGVRRVPPLLGEHSEDVLTALGYTRDDVRTLRAQRVIA